MAAARRGGLDGGLGSGIPLPDGKKKRLDEDDEDIPATAEPAFDEFELEHDDAEPSDRRRDPLRKPGT